MLQFDIVIYLIYGKLRYTISYQSYSQLIIGTAFRSVKLLSWDQSQDTINRAIYQLLKILTIIIWAYNGHAKCCLNWNVYDISVNCQF